MMKLVLSMFDLKHGIDEKRLRHKEVHLEMFKPEAQAAARFVGDAFYQEDSDSDMHNVVMTKEPRARQVTNADKISGLMQLIAHILNFIQSDWPRDIQKVKVDLIKSSTNAIYNAKTKEEVKQALDIY